MTEPYQLTLPPFAFLDDQTGGESELEGRNVILSVRSACVFEVFSEDQEVALNRDVLKKTFFYKSPITNHTPEKHTVVMHTNPLQLDREVLVAIMESLWLWYAEYLQWEDKNIMTNDSARLN
ncbi:hypothetical protein [Roseivirga seohaensis]|uniref:hypothetical protein n=1 Tax=Roseivirga seohaensis TaxID=1914963 RepID=UPI003BA8CBA2